MSSSTTPRPTVSAGTPAAGTLPGAAAHDDRFSPHAPPPPAHASRWKLPLTLLILALAAGVAYFNPSTQPYVLSVFKNLRHVAQAITRPTTAPPPTPMPKFSNEPWNGLVPVTAEQESAIGMALVRVEPQTEPMRLDLHGTTAYDQDALTQIRPRFDSLVMKVYKSLGDPVKKGDPLVDVYSNDLASAKSDFQRAYVQNLFDMRLVESRKQLVKEGSFSEVEFVKTENDANKSALDYRLARDKLFVYGLTDEEIEPLLRGLDQASFEKLAREGVAEKASMTMRSPAEGIVIKRDVVVGNLYEPASVLMVIAPVDHLRVYGNVYESDIDKVQVGQELEIHFPFLDRNIRQQVEVISNQVDPDTHAMRIRTTIKNPGGRLKADMLVRMTLEIPPIPGYTIIPRQALVTTNGNYYAFVKNSNSPAPAKAQAKDKAASADEAGDGPKDMFERRQLRLKQEKSDQVIVADGLHPGEEIVTSGSLILSQMYEDQQVVDTGSPP